MCRPRRRAKLKPPLASASLAREAPRAGGQARLAGRSSTPLHAGQAPLPPVASVQRQAVAVAGVVARSASGSARRPRAPAARTTLSRPQPAVTTTDDVSRDMSLSAHRRRSDQTLRGYVPSRRGGRGSARQPRARACRSQSATCRATCRTRVSDAMQTIGIGPLIVRSTASSG
jgi:hypothetical protein